jgi:hypothetical protein
VKERLLRDKGTLGKGKVGEKEDRKDGKGGTCCDYKPPTFRDKTKGNEARRVEV